MTQDSIPRAPRAAERERAGEWGPVGLSPMGRGDSVPSLVGIGSRIRNADLVVPALIGLASYAWLSAAIVLPVPFVFADEFSYAFRAKYGWNAFPGEPGLLVGPFPNLLFFALFRWTHAFGDRFLEAARALNAVLFGLTAFPLYLVCRRFAGVGVSTAIGLLFCTGPTSSYAAYFMPEPMYVLVFWLVVLGFVRFVERPAPSRVTVLAVLLATLTLVKPHALMLSACFLALVPAVILSLPAESPLRRGVLRASVAFAVVYYGTWICGASLLAGQLLFDPVGALYGGILKQSASAGISAEMVRRIAVLAGKHAAVLVVLYGVPMYFAFGRLVTARTTEAEARTRTSTMVALAGFMILAILALMTVKFSVDVSGFGPYESIERLHGRYYGFVLPLLLVAAAGAVPAERVQWSQRLRVLGLIALLAISVVVIRSVQPQGWADFPESYAITSRPWVLWVAVAGSLLAAACALRRPVQAWHVYLVCFALVSAVTRLDLWQLQRHMPIVDEDRAGQLMRATLTGQDRDAVMIFARGVDARPFRLAFYLMSRAKFGVTGDADRVDCAAIPTNTVLVATLDPVDVACDFVRTASVGQVDLFRRGRPAGDDLLGGDVHGTEVWLTRAHRDAYSTWGFHRAEVWGSWTAAPNAGVVLPQPVTGCVDVVVKGHAFGPNIGRDITARLGDEEARLAFAAEDAKVTARYRLTRPARSLEFSGMSPRSPVEAGVSQDGRPLGLGVVAVGVRECRD